MFGFFFFFNVFFQKPCVAKFIIKDKDKTLLRIIIFIYEI